MTQIIVFVIAVFMLILGLALMYHALTFERQFKNRADEIQKSRKAETQKK